ncbi:MAG: zinc-binding dehydrogenase [Candidatus Poribacteria bacterium]|nr:zinc-binding dehydrogenase [Candidatus Poribacteria bacterium]
MKAIVFYEQGEIDKLVYQDHPDPEIDVDEILVKVGACAVNRLDLNARSYRPEIQVFPHILGSDIAGEVIEIGLKVNTVDIGDRVVLSPNIPCEKCRDCLSGAENLCDYQQLLGFQTHGGYAELVKAPAQNAIGISERLSYPNAAALPIAYLTAWHMLVTRAEIKSGDDILILATGSGVGSAGLQIAKLHGARVFAASSTNEKLDRAKKTGADFAINYKETDFMEAVLELTDGRGVDVVFEHVGAATWDQSIASLAKNGRLVTCGATTGNIGEINIRKMYQKQITLLGSALGTITELRAIVDLVDQDKLTPIIDSVLPLADAYRSHQIMEKRENFGKICLIP